MYFDSFGLDPVGVCGVKHLNSLIFTMLYLLGTSSIVATCYILTILFYQRLTKWIRETSSLLTVTEETQQTLIDTNHALSMMKWITIAPLFFVMPSITVETVLRFFPSLISVSITRLILSTFSFCSVLNPLVTIYFTKRYRRVLQKLVAKTRFTQFFYLLFTCKNQARVSTITRATEI
jgi:hypothetical protein